jgi:hypothetical protein
VTKAEWDLRVGYEPRLGSIYLAPIPPHHTEPAAHFRLPVSTILRDLHIPAEALGQQATDAARPGVDDGRTVEELMRAAVPADCTGLTVLDIGGFDGRLAALAHERGAIRSICLDNEQWTHYGWTRPEPLPGVEYVRGDFLEWREPVDVTLFMNVAYHCKNPWAAFEHLRNITRKEMFLCSLVTWTEKPVWELYEPGEVNPDDDTVYWGPSESGLTRLLKLTDWTEVEVVGKALERLVLRCR